ncbi:helix-turn-helix domain-containing protein [Alicyclobacillus tolerans]|uniref:helix-turn-helix domain-containing protein n=1 Tax=Alicyclobacillus tolerans TaxID=90970 RepID=UPI003B7CD1D7
MPRLSAEAKLTPEMEEAFLSFLKDHIVQGRLSQEDMARKAGISASYLNAVVHGRKHATRKTAAKVVFVIGGREALQEVFPKQIELWKEVEKEMEAREVEEWPSFWEPGEHLLPEPAPELLYWFGIAPDSTVLGKKVEDFEELQEGTLVYLEEDGRGTFWLVHEEKEEFWLEPPDAFIVRSLRLENHRAYWKSWGLDAKRVYEQKMPEKSGSSVLYRVSGVYTPVVKGIRPFMIPHMEYLSRNDWVGIAVLTAQLSTGDEL